MLRKRKSHAGLFTLLLLLLAFLLALSRLVYITFNKDIGTPKYEDPRLPSSLVRGSIYDRNGTLLAIQAPDYVFRVNLAGLTPSLVARELAPYTALTPLEAEEILRRGVVNLSYNGIPTSENIEEIDAFLESSGLSKNIEFVVIEERKYPKGGFMSTLLGETDPFFRGTSGLEAAFNERLSAEAILGLTIASGEDLHITIDESLQRALEGIPNSDGRRVLVIDSNGDILALTGEADEETLSLLELGVDHSDNPYLAEAEDISGDGSYFVYVEPGAKRFPILSEVEDILRLGGRIH